MNRQVAIATGLAVAAAAAYSVSPMTALFFAALWLLLRVAVRGVGGAERVWVLGSLMLAAAIRLLALAWVYVSTDPFRQDFNALFGDGRYSIQRSLWILYEWSGVPIAPLSWLNIYSNYGAVGYDKGLALMQWVVGPSPYGLSLISVTMFFAGAVALYRIARPTFGSAAATAGLVTLVLWPTFIIWSVSMLKESVHLLLAAIAVCAAVQAARVDRWSGRLVLAGVFAACTLLTVSVRGGGHVFLLAAALCGYAAFAGARRSAVAVALAAAAVIATTGLASRPAVRERVEAEFVHAVNYHVGDGESIGKSYRAADQYFYDAWPFPPSVDFGEGARYLMRSIAMFVAAPLPSQVVSASELLFLPQHFAWCLLVFLACVGTCAGLRRDALLTGILAGYCVVGMVVIALYSGNIGTLIRHRDMIVPFMVWLAAVGARSGVDVLGGDSHAAC